jgi:6-phospho-beta-glucosidase
MKVTVFGGGSTYTPELVNGFLTRIGSFPLRELWLMDVDPQRLTVVGGFAQRMAAAKGSPFQVILTTDQKAAIEGAAYVTTQLRVGMMTARRGDEYLGKRHGLIGQETTGIGGMAKALRTIPVLLSIAADMRQLAPNALLVNFTNPSGLVTEALQRYAPDVPSVGVCNAPIGMQMRLTQLWNKLTGRDVALEQTALNTLGLNHLTWHRGFTIHGEEVWPQLFAALRDEIKTSGEWPLHVIESLGMIPNYYIHYFYRTAHKLAEQEQWPPSRGEVVMEVEEGLLKDYANPSLSEPPADLMKRGGAYYSTVATQLLNAHFNGLNETHVVNTRHNGAVAGWPADWVLEMPCKVSRSGITPLPAEPLPPVCFGLLAQIKSYELLTVEAAVRGDRKALYQALLAHPLGPEADEIPAVMEDLLATNAAWLPQFQ